MSELPNNIEPREGTVVSGDRIDYGVYGIKCDSCDYSDMNVPYEDYPQYVDKPCPECGALLLTNEQLREVNASIQAAQRFNAMSDEQLSLIENQIKLLSPKEQEKLLKTLPSWITEAMPSTKT
jgi:hypothetical protein